MNVDAITLPNFKLAALSIEKKCDAALHDWKTYRDSHKLRVAAEKERIAYLHGVLHGLYQAVRELENRCPLEFYGSEE